MNPTFRVLRSLKRKRRPRFRITPLRVKQRRDLHAVANPVYRWRRKDAQLGHPLSASHRFRRMRRMKANYGLRFPARTPRRAEEPNLPRECDVLISRMSYAKQPIKSSLHGFALAWIQVCGNTKTGDQVRKRRTAEVDNREEKMAIAPMTCAVQVIVGRS